MFEIKVRDEFCGAHNLRGYKGKCEGLHGHNWKVEVKLRKNTLNSQGMVMDFKELKALLRGVLSDLDHKHLNELRYFKKINPTSENTARFIHEELSKRIKKKIKVSVWETENSCASFEK
ncbi:MAG: 6-carboxytetrahydropterin synthase QueD [Omnitrophica bacterium]|nr:6-carboxytetrahydropterin synthase QueD [Candidatus Omnitrophota bacterium]